MSDFLPVPENVAVYRAAADWHASTHARLRSVLQPAEVQALDRRVEQTGPLMYGVTRTRTLVGLTQPLRGATHVTPNTFTHEEGVYAVHVTFDNPDPAAPVEGGAALLRPEGGMHGWIDILDATMVDMEIVASSADTEYFQAPTPPEGSADIGAHPGSPLAYFARIDAARDPAYYLTRPEMQAVQQVIGGMTLDLGNTRRHLGL